MLDALVQLLPVFVEGNYYGNQFYYSCPAAAIEGYSLSVIRYSLLVISY